MTTKIRFLALEILLAAIGNGFGQPVITNQPTGQSVSLGATVSFQPSTTGTPPLTYEWRFNGGALPGATNRSLIITNAQSINAGDYVVVVANSSGSVTSQVAHLEVDPTFTKITTGQIVTDGGTSSACAWGDYDNDGFLDLFVTNTQGLDDVEHKNFLYQNNGDGTFTKITTGTLVNDIERWRGCGWADFDNDGNLDLMVADSSENDVQAILYRGNGDGTFTRMPGKTLGGIVPAGQGTAEAPVWADYDNDGLVDLFIGGYGFDRLYHNEGNGLFNSITNDLAGSVGEDSYGSSWADYNNDGHPDLFVPVFSSSTALRNHLYTNLGAGVFDEVTSGTLITNTGPAGWCAWGDYDNDGFLDLIVTAEGNYLFHNNGDGTFTKMTSDIVGSLVSDIGNSTTCVWGDYDNDGYLDLFVANQGGPFARSYGVTNAFTNFLYHNNGDGSFTRILTGSLVNEVADPLGCAWGDYDNDGFLDLFIANGTHVSENNSLFRNNGNSNGWLKVKLVGTVSNRSAIGAKIRVKATIGGKTFWQLREISTGSGRGQNPLEAHFGLGMAPFADSVRIEWPSGIVQELPNVASRQFLTVVEPPKLSVQLTKDGPLFSIKGGRGLQYQVEGSTDLLTWPLVGTLTISAAGGTAQIIDANAPGSNRRFYRAYSQ